MARKTLKKTFPVSIQAHRGFKKLYPENTLLAFRKAIETKADYVELDIHFSRDHEIVVCHDYTTGRVGNQNLIIKDSDVATLKTLDVGQGEKIPTLQEVFDLCKGKIGINIEIKHAGLAVDLNDLILKNGMENEVIISSFVHSEITEMKKINSKLICATLEPIGSGKLPYFRYLFQKSIMLTHAIETHADAIHPFSKFVTKSFCDQAHAKDLLVNPWTSDTPKEWQKLIDSGVDSIITNDPAGLYQFLAQK